MTNLVTYKGSPENKKQYNSFSRCSSSKRAREIYNDDLQKENLYWNFIELE